jgi:hypothetical protein
VVHNLFPNEVKGALILSLHHRYVPNSRLQYEYPDNYEAAVQQSCLDDSNILERPDTEREPYLVGAQDRGDEEAKAQCGRDYH